VGTLSAADIRLISNVSHAASALSKPIKLFVLSGNKTAEKVLRCSYTSHLILFAGASNPRPHSPAAAVCG
jgi:hypothetical protein